MSWSSAASPEPSRHAQNPWKPPSPPPESLDQPYSSTTTSLKRESWRPTPTSSWAPAAPAESSTSNQADMPNRSRRRSSPSSPRPNARGEGSYADRYDRTGKGGDRSPRIERDNGDLKQGSDRAREGNDQRDGDRRDWADSRSRDDRPPAGRRFDDRRWDRPRGDEVDRRRGVKDDGGGERTWAAWRSKVAGAEHNDNDRKRGGDWRMEEDRRRDEERRRLNDRDRNGRGGWQDRRPFDRRDDRGRDGDRGRRPSPDTDRRRSDTFRRDPSPTGSSSRASPPPRRRTPSPTGSTNRTKSREGSPLRGAGSPRDEREVHQAPGHNTTPVGRNGYARRASPDGVPPNQRRRTSPVPASRRGGRGSPDYGIGGGSAEGKEARNANPRPRSRSPGDRATGTFDRKRPSSPSRDTLSKRPREHSPGRSPPPSSNARRFRSPPRRSPSPRRWRRDRSPPTTTRRDDTDRYHRPRRGSPDYGDRRDSSRGRADDGEFRRGASPPGAARESIPRKGKRSPSPSLPYDDGSPEPASAPRPASASHSAVVQANSALVDTHPTAPLQNAQHEPQIAFNKAGDLRNSTSRGGRGSPDYGHGSVSIGSQKPVEKELVPSGQYIPTNGNLPSGPPPVSHPPHTHPPAMHPPIPPPAVPNQSYPPYPQYPQYPPYPPPQLDMPPQPPGYQFGTFQYPPYPPPPTPPFPNQPPTMYPAYPPWPPPSQPNTSHPPPQQLPPLNGDVAPIRIDLGGHTSPTKHLSKLSPVKRKGSAVQQFFSETSPSASIDPNKPNTSRQSPNKLQHNPFEGVAEVSDAPSGHALDEDAIKSGDLLERIAQSEIEYQQHYDSIAPYIQSAFKEWSSQDNHPPLTAFLNHYFGRQPDGRELHQIERLVALKSQITQNEKDLSALRPFDSSPVKRSHGHWSPPRRRRSGPAKSRSRSPIKGNGAVSANQIPLPAGYSRMRNGQHPAAPPPDDSAPPPPPSPPASKSLTTSPDRNTTPAQAGEPAKSAPVGLSRQGAKNPTETYERLDCVGEGTYGKVYKARNTETGVYVALKRIRMEGEKDGFPVTAMREIKLLQSLKHENVICLHEMMVSKGSVHMVFEYMEHDLTGLLSHHALTFSPANLKSLNHQMLSGLAYLHRKGILHRDMKGSNILLDAAGVLKLADFGLARLYNRKRKADYTNRVITLWYRSPELLLGETAYGPEVDMWSAGCIMLEMFTTKPIFQGNDEIHQLEVIYSVMGTPDETSWPGVRDLPWYELVRPKQEIASKFREQFNKWLSPAALDLAQGLLAFNPSQRLSASEALKAEYFTVEFPKMERPSQLSNIGEHHEMSAKQERHRRKMESK